MSLFSGDQAVAFKQNIDSILDNLKTSNNIFKSKSSVFNSKYYDQLIPLFEVPSDTALEVFSTQVLNASDKIVDFAEFIHSDVFDYGYPLIKPFKQKKAINILDNIKARDEDVQKGMYDEILTSLSIMELMTQELLDLIKLVYNIDSYHYSDSEQISDGAEDISDSIDECSSPSF